MIALLRLAIADARRHRVRTLLSSALIATLAAGSIFVVSSFTTKVPTRDAALAQIPADTQALITATAVLPGAPLAQLPEQLPAMWSDDSSQVPLTPQQLTPLLPPGTQLAQYWDLTKAIFAVGLTGSPGEILPADSATTLSNTGLSSLTVADLRELDQTAATFMLPEFAAGSAPKDPSEIVISTALAQRLHLGLHDTVSVIAPPFNGWFSTDGRLREVVQNEHKMYRVSGIAPSSEERAWAQAGWVSQRVAADPAGVDQTYLAYGDKGIGWETVRRLNEQQVLALSRQAIVDYPDSSQLYPVKLSAQEQLLAFTMFTMLAIMASALVLALVTPTFAVAAQRQRRVLGIVAAIGGTAKNIGTMIGAQGLVVGLFGGVAGTLVGTIAAWLFLLLTRPETNIIAYFPWWSLPTAVGGSAFLGWLATLAPARWAARQQPLDAIHARPTYRREHHAAYWLGPALLTLSALCGFASLLVARPERQFAENEVPHTSAPTASVALFTVALICGLSSIYWLIRLAVKMLSRLRQGPLTLRFAARDAAKNPSRIVPATVSVAICSSIASLSLIVAGSTAANETDTTLSFVREDALVLGPEVPVSADFDQALLTAATAQLGKELPVRGSHPIYSLPTGTKTTLLSADNPGCSQGLVPSVESARIPAAQLTCLPPEQGYVPQLTHPWWLGRDTFVMSPEAIRATRWPNAEAAADFVAAGGVLVSDATRVVDGKVQVQEVDLSSSQWHAIKTTSLPGMYVGPFAGVLVMSPATAASLGADNYIFVGSVVETTRPLTRAETSKAITTLHAYSPLVRAQTGAPAWLDDSLLVPGVSLSVIAILSGVVCVLLARTQLTTDLYVMHTIGASARFTRGIVIQQAALVIGLGLSAGMALGLSLGSYLIAWNRHFILGGAWRSTVYLGWFQVALVAAIALCGVGSAWLLSRGAAKHSGASHALRFN